MNAVIPGRAEGAAPRNDEERESPHDSRGREIATAGPYQRQAENG